MQTFGRFERVLKGLQFYSRIQALLEDKPHVDIRANMIVRAYQKNTKQSAATRLQRFVQIAMKPLDTFLFLSVFDMLEFCQNFINPVRSTLRE